MTRIKKTLIAVALALTAAAVACTSAPALADTAGQDSGVAHTDNTHITSGDA
jgi:Spy/CpxP family protein refolding chaperone